MNLTRAALCTSLALLFTAASHAATPAAASLPAASAVSPAVGPMVSPSLSAEEAYAIASEAYTYTYPLVSMGLTRRQMTNVPAGVRPGYGPVNSFSHTKAFPPASWRVVVRSNFDTLYSSAWLDLAREPMIITVPETQGRYYMMPMLDMWTDVFAVPGSRTTGSAAGNYAVVPQGWQGKLPAGVARIEAPTPTVWVIGRVQTNGPADFAAVHAVQAGMKITPLSQWGKAPVAMPVVTPDPNIDMKTPPLRQVHALSPVEHFRYAAELLQKIPPHVTDQAQLTRLARIGFIPGQPFDASKLPAPILNAVERAARDTLAQLHAAWPQINGNANGWIINNSSAGVYGNYYLKRAATALFGIGMNQPEDAVYPSSSVDADGQPYDGKHAYVLHFDKAQLPPVGAFWSVTLYDGEGFQVGNPLNRFAIGDRDPLRYNADGSLDLYIQNAAPGGDKDANWLPAPAANFNLMLRLYAPSKQILEGRWLPPAVQRLP